MVASASKSADPASGKHPSPNFFSFWRKPKKLKEDPPPWARIYRRFTLEELRFATLNFNSKLGQGGFCSVYKGFFNGDFKETVVVKMYYSLNGPQLFLREMESPSKRDHPNILSLIGYCIEGPHRYVVSEYMPHGDLHDQLHNQKTLLSWKRRVEICIGAARGLEFLHSGTPSIIHRNIKSSNILLDRNWFPRISDFEISRFVPTGLSETDSHVSTVVAGTVGYLDPEYLRTGHLSLKSDVYSFGVVLFEVLSARKPIEMTMTEEHGTHGMQWWRQCVEDDRVGEILDPRMNDEVVPGCLRAYADIAYACANNRGSERPTMADVVKRLEQMLLFQECFEAGLPFSPSSLGSIVPPPKKNEPLFEIEFQDSDMSVSNYDSDELLRD
ncbi:Detected protein of unknown function [Hibiscus syriacus]|uniref:Protein kinase domain-containing protein n=1 Tax=Hibiscus syriacus TaxID=106335 RepID=A0A6A3AK20_HIBSY|nr:receptor-like protein kinase ANXUR2 [Hibiscus syriacus]KAE8704456.1 Detected protein of unknown function [Hibiscus syriacus]